MLIYLNKIVHQQRAELYLTSGLSCSKVVDIRFFQTNGTDAIFNNSVQIGRVAYGTQAVKIL